MAQGAAAWSLRLNPRVRALYATAYRTDPSEMCVGMDNMMFTPGTQPHTRTSGRVWPHVDINVHQVCVHVCVFA